MFYVLLSLFKTNFCVRNSVVLPFHGSRISHWLASISSIWQRSNQDRLRFFSQQCDTINNKRQWTINDNLQCSDNDVTTKDDQCLSGVCKGTPYNCLECEQHEGAGGCRIKSGYCIIGTGSQRKCYAKEDKELSSPCQVGFPVRLLN